MEYTITAHEKNGSAICHFNYVDWCACHCAL